ncbi:MAG: tetratricopeptide repeat protein [Thermoleophilia bacterium]
MKKHFALIGIGAAVLAAAAIVAVGAASGGGTAAEGSPSGQALPPGHPTVAADAPDADAATAEASVTRSIKELERARDAKPRDIDVLLKLGDAYLLAQRYRQAADTLAAALRLRPGHAAATVRLALVWHAEGDSERAIDAIEGVLADDPDNQEAHYSLAIVYFSQEELAKAQAEWTRAAKADPSTSIGRRSQSFVDLLEGRQTPDSPTGE